MKKLKSSRKGLKTGIEKLEKEIKTMEYSIQTGNCPEYQNIFRLDEDDYKALIEVRRKKIKELVKDL